MRWRVVPKGLGPKGVVRWGTGVRLVTDVGKRCISFVRWRSSWCWRGGRGGPGGRNACVTYDLPFRLQVVRRGDHRTRELAYRFRDWLTLGTPSQAEWDAVCALQVEAIRCAC